MNNMPGSLLQSSKAWIIKLQKDGIISTRLIILGVLGIGLMVFAGVMESQETGFKKDMINDNPNSTIVTKQSYEDALESKLAHMLSQVRGAGHVAVNITFEDSGIQEFAKNKVKESKVVQEKEAAGGTRTTTETKESEQILMSKDGGTDRPVVVDTIKPVVKGVLVIAEGAYDSNVKANLVSAVEAGLGVPAYRITVLAYRK